MDFFQKAKTLVHEAKCEVLHTLPVPDQSLNIDALIDDDAETSSSASNSSSSSLSFLSSPLLTSEKVPLIDLAADSSKESAEEITFDNDMPEPFPPRTPELEAEQVENVDESIQAIAKASSVGGMAEGTNGPDEGIAAEHPLIEDIRGMNPTTTGSSRSNRGTKRRGYAADPAVKTKRRKIDIDNDGPKSDAEDSDDESHAKKLKEERHPISCRNDGHTMRNMSCRYEELGMSMPTWRHVADLAMETVEYLLLTKKDNVELPPSTAKNVETLKAMYSVMVKTMGSPLVRYDDSEQSIEAFYNALQHFWMYEFDVWDLVKNADAFFTDESWMKELHLPLPGLPYSVTPVTSDEVRNARPLMLEDFPSVAEEKVLTVELGPEMEEVPIVHAVDSLPIRVDAHQKIAEHIGYLVLKYKPGRKTWPDKYVFTRRWAMDLMIQNFFPGPTWMAVAFALHEEEMPIFVKHRLDAIMKYYEMAWNAYVDAYGLKENMMFNNSINNNNREWKGLKIRVADLRQSVEVDWARRVGFSEHYDEAVVKKIEQLRNRRCGCFLLTGKLGRARVLIHPLPDDAARAGYKDIGDGVTFRKKRRAMSRKRR